MINQTIRVASALNKLDKEYSEYGPIISKIRLVKDNREGTTFWINPHCEMGYNEKVASKFDDDTLKAVVHHELLHVMYGHFIRAETVRKIFGNFSSEVHNIAMDLEINSRLVNLPEWAQFPKKYKFPDNLTYEEYFIKLTKDAETIYVGLAGGNDVDLDWINQCEDVNNKSSTTDTLSNEDKLFSEDILQEIEENSKKRGTERGGGKYKIRLSSKPPLNILNYIRTQCSRIRNDRTFGYDLINYNSIKQTTIPDIVDFTTYSEVITVTLSFIIDVSGSRTDTQINDSISKIWSLLNTMDDMSYIIDLFFTDSAVTQVNRVTKKEDIPKTFPGRGGTVLSSAFAKFKTPYDLVIIMTDGDIDWNQINNIDAKYKSRTVVGIDKERYLATYTNSKLPTFIL